jgi:hypothetical protein
MDGGLQPALSSSTLARRIVGLLSRKWSGTSATPLYPVLSAIQGRILRRSRLEDMLAALDSSKPALYEFFRKHRNSPLEAKALTFKILNFCLARYHFHCRSAVLVTPF